LRTLRIDRTLHGVMIETAKTTSLVFIILLGAAMLTSAFRAFGGEELVKEFLTSLPGGFWAQFIIVMAVIFLLGFFLDFIEIAVVVVPIVSPILLADPQANITAVWLGVMIGLNIQTSFLTPPFGFALFYSAWCCAIECGNHIDLQGRGSVHPVAAAGTGHCRLHAEPGELSADQTFIAG
jgi:TRAP-type mannitol/chloroaromatic compound transport system permease large subunit